MTDAVRTIKKYPNRRLYDTANSGYITLADVKQMVLENIEFVVVDAKSGDDLTRSILLQIILDEEGGGVPMFSSEMLAQMIRLYGSAQQTVMGQYMEQNVKAGDVITYTVTVTNTGDVPLSNIVVIDVLEGGAPTTLSCTPTTLAPGESAVCASYTHTITSAEANAGGTLDNTVTASGQGPGGGTETVTADATAADLLIARPGGLAATVLGAAVFVVGLPFTLINGSTGQAAQQLVVEPAQYTFTRPLGQDL